MHEAVAKSTELDLMNWVMRAAPLHRQTCRHAAEKVSPVPTIAHTKDGRWVISSSLTQAPEKMLGFLDEYGMGEPLRRECEVSQGSGHATSASGRPIPGSGNTSELASRFQESLQRLTAKFTYADVPWREAQEAGLWVAPLRLPEESIYDEHWVKRGSFAPVAHPELGTEFLDVTSKWISSETPWQVGRRAPLLDEDADVLDVAWGAAPARVVSEQPLRTARATACRRTAGTAGGTGVRLQLVPRLGRRHPVPCRARRRRHQGGVEGSPRHSDGRDGAGRRTGGARRRRPHRFSV